MRFLILTSALLIGGCCHAPPQNEGQPATVEDVVRKIKIDLERYQRYDAVASLDAALPNACGGKVNFLIAGVKVQLTPQTADKVSGSAALTLPVGSGTFGPSFSNSRETKGTQTLTFALFPKPVGISNDKGKRAPDLQPIDATQYPIAAALQRLREGLLKTSGETPCFDLVSEGNEKDSVGSFAFGFTVINDVSAGGTLKFAVVSLGATTESQRQAGNTITVTFIATGSSASFMLE